jgi:site-specific DNA-methyltransferase (adenine-specific)
MRDVWEIPFLNPKAKERTGYPTQKPIDLLLRIVDSSSNEGDIVLDPFCGSVTTLVAAKLRSRKWIGIDSNEDAVRISQQRLDGSLGELEPTRHDVQYRLSTFLKLPRDSKVRALATLLEMNIVYRSKDIDGFLRRTGRWGSVAVRYLDHEAKADAIEGFLQACQNRRVKLGIVIMPRVTTSEKQHLESLYRGQTELRELSVEDAIQRKPIAEALVNEPLGKDWGNS